MISTIPILSTGRRLFRFKMAMKFKIGDLVWAKMKSYPPWPGIVSDPSSDGKTTSEKKSKQFIVFYGSDSYAWIGEDQLWPYVEFREKYLIAQRAPLGFKEAVDAIEDVLRTRQGGSLSKVGDKALSVDELREIFPNKQTDSDSENIKDASSSKDSAAVVPSGGDGDNQMESPLKTRSKRRSEHVVKESSEPRKKSKVMHTRKSLTEAHDRDCSRATSLVSKVVGDSSAAISTFLPDILSCPPKPEGTSLKIGFLGLGNMGSLLVSRLLKSGHDLTVWNRTPSKCRDFVTQGAAKGMSPGDVVQTCDITFSCVSDSAALKDLVFGNTGVAQAMGPGKAFVDMSSLDVDTATEVYEALAVRGGRFLEAPIVGPLDADEEPGQLIIVAAGDASLFEDCSSMFNAVAKRTFYIGEVGSATCTKLVVNMVFGTMIASLAEALSLGEKVGLQQEQILTILKLLPISSALSTTKGAAMIHRRFNPRYLSVEQMQRDLRLAITLAEPILQPVHVTTATNELFKKAKAQAYGDHDTAAIYRATE